MGNGRGGRARGVGGGSELAGWWAGCVSAHGGISRLGGCHSPYPAQVHLGVSCVLARECTHSLQQRASAAHVVQP
eukprot:1569874-Alexandrium_andersonii.AAC.1